MVMVYAHRIKDGNTSQMVVAAHKRTEAAIKFLHGETIPGTGEDVPDTAVDGEGRYAAPAEKNALRYSLALL